MKKIITALVFLVAFLFVVHTKIYAQQPSVQTQLQPNPNGVYQAAPVKPVYPLNTDSDVPQDFHTYSQNVFIEILTNISCLLTGYDPLTSSGKCLGIDTVTHKIGYVDSGGGGAIGIVGNMISMTFDIPVSSTTYFKDLATNFGITKTQYAATSIPTDPNGNTKDNAAMGYGFNGLKPVLDVWKIFRNLVYLVLVLLFITIGLGIMFRVNIDARSVMSIQNQLPRIIIGILLVTFSYAIAGLIVDLMYVIMYLIYYVFIQQTLNIDVSGLNPSYLQGTSPLGAIGGIGGASDLASGAAGPIGHILASLFDNNFGHIIGAIIGGIIGAGAGSIIPGVGTIIGGLVGAAAGTFAGSRLLGVVGGLIAYIVITIAILWAMFRLWFLLLRSYIFFLIDVVIAPFWIGIGLIPKIGTAGFGSWFRDIVANLAVFPATLFILILGKIFVTQFSTSATNHSFVPPLIGNPGDPGSFGSIIGLGVILLLPGVVTMVRDTLKAPGFKYTQAIGQSLKAGSGLAQQGRGLVGKALWKDNKLTGKPEGVKKWFYGKVGKNVFGPIGKGIPGKIGSKIGASRFNPITPLKSRANNYRASRQNTQTTQTGNANGTQANNNAQGGANTQGANVTQGASQGGQGTGLPGQPPSNGSPALPHAPNTQTAQADADTDQSEQQRPALADMPSEISDLIKEGNEHLTEADIERIGRRVREELHREGKSISELTNLTPEDHTHIRELRDNAQTALNIPHARDINTAADQRSEPDQSEGEGDTS